LETHWQIDPASQNPPPYLILTLSAAGESRRFLKKTFRPGEQLNQVNEPNTIRTIAAANAVS
jgi:hypothetical protein